MNPNETPDGQVHEIVIIKRHCGHDDDGHHGGVWKVAFADFMTAMMAFFLVLWIVNSTTREVKTSLARYFNPIKLTESTPAKKGVTETKEQQDETPPEPKADSAGAANSPGDRHGDEKTKPNAGTAETQHAPAGAKPDASVSKPNAQKEVSQSAAQSAKEPPPAPAASSGGEQAEFASSDDRPTAPAQDGKEKADADVFRDPFDKRLHKPAVAGGAKMSAQMIADNLKQELKEVLGSDEFARIESHLEIKTDPEGVLISLADGSDYGMFTIGSAEPDARLVRTLGAVGQALRTKGGPVVLRGHTDARQYRGGQIDNWQLSQARALAAFRILQKGGVAEKRLERVEGYADHKPKKPNDIYAPENRRIEILLRRERP